MSISRALGATASPSYNIDDLLQSVQNPATNPTQPSKFRRVLGGIVGGLGNLVMPGIGSSIGNMISGGALNSTGLLGDSTQYLQLQSEMEAESRTFETASTILKCRQDSTMDAIRNMKSS
jgi:predicted lipid-binding transport protein (Tim44 family)